MQLQTKLKLKKDATLGADAPSKLFYYLPLIGCDGLSLYVLLFGLYEDEYEIKNLIDMSTIKTLKELKNAFNKLAGIGLVELYKSKTDALDEMCVLRDPLSKQTFFSSLILTEQLKEKTGKAFNFLKPRVLVKKGYEKLTPSYDEVFKRSKKENRLISPIKLSGFNYVFFISLFSKDEFPSTVLETEEVKRTVEECAFLYKLSESDMRSVLKTVLVNESDLTVETIKNQAKLFYNKNKDATELTTTVINNDNYLDSEKNDKQLKLLNYLEKASVEEILYQLTKMQPLKKDVLMFEKIKSECMFTQGVMNVLILYVNRLKEGKRVSENYYLTIASEWKAKKVDSTFKAYLIFLELVKPKPKEKRVLRSEVVPEWFKKSEDIELETTDENADLLKELFDYD